MAIGAFGHGGMFVLMTKCTVELLVFAGIGGQILIDFRVTEPAEFGRSIVGIGDIFRAMRFVTFQTIFVNLRLIVAVMTSETFVDGFVTSGMANRTILLGMHAGEGVQLLTLLTVTGQADGNGLGGVFNTYV